MDKKPTAKPKDPKLQVPQSKPESKPPQTKPQPQAKPAPASKPASTPAPKPAPVAVPGAPAKSALAPTPAPPAPASPSGAGAPTGTPAPTPTLDQLHQAVESLRQLVVAHTLLIGQLQEALARKRRPVQSNQKVLIKDKHTNKVYPSKNNAYRSMLKSGELKALVDKGVFGVDPEKNTFGWYALVREWPDRFEEVAASPK